MREMGQSAALAEPRSLLLRGCRVSEFGQINRIINAGAEAYRGVIPAEGWHEPYMSEGELASEIVAGVSFWGAEIAGTLVGVMGVQPSGDVDLIRHAYVLPEYQGYGIGGALLGHLISLSRRRVLVGTWADAAWAVRFYERHGFRNETDDERRLTMLRKYWNVPERQIQTAVVLSL